MARIYAPNQHHNCDYGVDFINGVASVPDADVTTINWFTHHGYLVVPGTDTLSPWDLLPVEQLRIFAPFAGIDSTGMTKAQLVMAIETALITLMKIEITAFDAIPDIDGGTIAEPVFADKDEVIAALPEFVTATFANGSKATVPVTAWADTDTYNKGTAGKYTFTATLGAIPLPFANTAGVTATVKVEVKA
mgnify:CR=1 FL=1|jgi:hypothetical protein